MERQAFLQTISSNRQFLEGMEEVTNFVIKKRPKTASTKGKRRIRQSRRRGEKQEQAAGHGPEEGCGLTRVVPIPIDLGARNARNLLDQKAKNQRRPVYASKTWKEALPEILEAKNETALRSESKDKQAQLLINNNKTEENSLSSLNATDPCLTVNQVHERAPSSELYEMK